MPKHPATIADFPDGSDERLEAALAVAGTTDPVDAHVADWGDVDGDHTQEGHDRADGINESGAQDPYTYYDSGNLRDNDITPLK